MTSIAIARQQLESASHELVWAIHEEIARTDDGELRSLLHATRAAIEREVALAMRAPHAHVVGTTRDLERRLAVLVAACGDPDDHRMERRRGPHADLTDFLGELRAAGE